MQGIRCLMRSVPAVLSEQMSKTFSKDTNSIAHFKLILVGYLLKYENKNLLPISGKLKHATNNFIGWRLSRS